MTVVYDCNGYFFNTLHPVHTVRYNYYLQRFIGGFIVKASALAYICYNMSSTSELQIILYTLIVLFECLQRTL